MSQNSFNVFDRFLAFGRQHKLLLPNMHYLLAVSGGLDSMVMTDLFRRAGIPFSLVHCNFQLRDEESERDAAFIISEAKRMGVEVYARNFETQRYAESAGVGIQEAARDLRYQWFGELMQNLGESGDRYLLATAHHRNDNAETMLFNILRGTGIQGLTGIAVRRENIIRPLLFASREELEKYAAENHIEFVEDSSNESTKYTRNFIRHNLLPAAKNVFPDPVQALTALGERMQETEQLLRQTVEKKKSKLLRQEGNEYFLSVLLWKKSEAKNLMLLEIARPFGFRESQIPELIKLMDGDNGSSIDAKGYRAIKHHNHLVFAPLGNEQKAMTTIHEPGIYKVSDGMMKVSRRHIDEVDFLNLPPGQACIDSRLLRFPLVLRPWQQGDYFYPLGMRKKKKISRFLIDQKLSVTEKEKAWVLESDKWIVWVVGMRIDDRVKVGNGTGEVLVLEWTSR